VHWLEKQSLCCYCEANITSRAAEKRIEIQFCTALTAVAALLRLPRGEGAEELN